MFLFLIELIVICLWGTRYVGGNDFISMPLEFGSVTALRGGLALEIVLGHVYGRIAGTNLLFINSRIGVWPVGVFFFLSGYGLLFSFHKKDNYLQDFILKRIGGTLFPFLTVFAFSFILNYFAVFESNNLTGIAEVLNYAIEFCLTLWFVSEIVVLYIIWYILYKHLSEKQALICLTILVILLNIFGCFFDVGTRWYGSTFCFILGIVFEKNESKILTFLKRNWSRGFLRFVFLFVSFSVLFILLSGWNIVLDAIIINMTCFICCIIIYMLMMKFRFGNPVTKWIGKISWVIYVLHPTVIAFFRQIEFENSFFMMNLFFASIFILSWLIYLFCQRVVRCNCINGGWKVYEVRKK